MNGKDLMHVCDRNLSEAHKRMRCCTGHLRLAIGDLRTKRDKETADRNCSFLHDASSFGRGPSCLLKLRSLSTCVPAMSESS